MILPRNTVALVSPAAARPSMLEVRDEDDLRPARSQWIPERRATVRHGMRSALDAARLLGGAIVTETAFSVDGIGRTAVVAITHQDQPVVANILVDIGCAVLDPRVRFT